MAYNSKYNIHLINDSILNMKDINHLRFHFYFKNLFNTI